MAKQRDPYPRHSRPKQKPTTPPAPAALPQRQGDRANTDEAEARLKILLRFADLKHAGYVRNWPTLLRLIDDEGFPPGFLLGRNMRAWVLDDVQAWIATRPTGRKIVTRRSASEAP
jgi:hypothetical protein